MKHIIIYKINQFIIYIIIIYFVVFVKIIFLTKIFFVIYILENSNYSSIKDIINSLENLISTYMNGKSVDGISKSEAKYIIEKGFFNALNEKFSI